MSEPIRVISLQKAYRIKVNSMKPSPSLPLPGWDVVEFVGHLTLARHHLIQEQQWGLWVDCLAQLKGGTLAKCGCDILKKMFVD